MSPHSLKKMFASTAGWDASAKAYVTNMQGESKDNIRLEMFVGRKLVADRVVSALASKVLYYVPCL